jgi:hypothetical protein
MEEITQVFLVYKEKVSSFYNEKLISSIFAAIVIPALIQQLDLIAIFFIESFFDLVL